MARELVGLPLARPWRRLFAFLADLIPVAILANSGLFVFLACTAAIATWRSLSPRRNRRVHALVRMGASFFVLVTVLRVGGVFDRVGRGFARDIDEMPPDSVARLVQSTMSSLGINVTTSTDSDSVDDATRELRARNLELQRENQRLQQQLEEDTPGGLTGWLGAISDDLGIGFGWGALYFTTLLVMMRGQTPGKRLMGVRVIRLDARPIGWWLAFERFGSYFASLSTGLLGFAQIFWDRNRQALHDKAVETVVVRVRRRDPDVANRLNAAQR